MAKFFCRLALAALAEWFCHKLDPTWKLKRARQRLTMQIVLSFEGATKAIEDLNSVLGKIAQDFATLSVALADEGDTS
jgi:hypothetical protein